ncbi:serine hydrolase [Ilumatobacter sp.]|uniref:serine hydrolase domain-containing protein n=1 Tax=Ilumatobacter sp. TaxID=1967498 RepID=UPI002637AB73|nr:serine hydrolase domain-containing protein [Ilumatobacter sp.]
MGRWAALATALAVGATACGQARLATPPEPEFVTGSRAEPVAPPTTLEGAGIVSDASSDIDVIAVDVADMVIIDDAGNAAPNRSGWAAFDQSLQRRMVPASVGASVAVMIDGQIVHQAAFGERVAGGGDPVETTDRFRIASISKTITAIVALQLVEDGVLMLDEPVGATIAAHLGLATYDVDAASITVRELLSHTAGFPQHEATFFSNGATSCPDAAAQGLSRSVSSGSGFRYSNMSYCVLGVLIEAVTGKTYERVVDERLLTPLGISGMRMTSTYELGPDEVSHDPSPDRNFMEALGAAGAWNATPADVVRIMNAVDPKTRGWKALSDETMSILRYRVPNALPPSGYGLGVINYDGDAYGHTGTLQNTHAMVLVQPDGLTWAVTVAGAYPSDSGQLRSIVRQALAAGFASA